MPQPDGLLEVGRIGRAHGVRGEVAVLLTTDHRERLAVGATLFARGRELTVLAARPHQERWLVTFDGIIDRNAAELLSGSTLLAEPIDDPEALWVHELIGAAVIDAAGAERGRCIGVLANPAHDILELDTGALVPVTFVVSFADGIVTVDPPEGLFELYEA